MNMNVIACVNRVYLIAFYDSRLFKQGGIFIVPHLLWHGASVFPVSSEGPSHLIASYDSQENHVIFKKGEIFIVPNLLWHGNSVFPISSETPFHLIAYYNLQGDQSIASSSREGSLSCHACCDMETRFSGLIRSTVPFNRLLRLARGPFNRLFKQGWDLYRATLAVTWGLGFPDSSEIPYHLIAYDDLQGDHLIAFHDATGNVEDLFNPNPHGSPFSKMQV
jgi:hypothetical protein